MANPRLLLFGTPGAGKSALLSALMQTAPSVQAKLIDDSDTLQRYHVEPDEKVSGPFSGDVTVIDCSGKSALEMMQAPEPFTGWHPMRKPILDADAVVLAVDVSAPRNQMNEDFRQAARWLRRLHETRGQRADVAELPVYVALTKCDLLARKEDTLESWHKRLDDIRRQYDDNFRKFLKEHVPGFGSIKLKVFTSAIKLPTFADKPAKDGEAFGVAELFRDCLQSAHDFSSRQQTAQSRLQNVIVALAGIIVLLALAVALLVEFQPPPKGATLDERLQLALPKAGATAHDRLGGTVKKLEERQARLTEIEQDADFNRLPSDEREAVTRYRREIAQYLQLQQEAQTALKLPHLAKNNADLREMEKTVRAFKLPEAYAQEWEETKLARRMRQVRGEYDVLEGELKSEEAWIRGQIATNGNLLKSGNRLYGKLLDQDKDAAEEAKKWRQQFNTAMNAKPPTPRDDNVPGVSRILYEDLGKFEPVKSVQKDWRTSKDDLANIAALIKKKLEH